MLLSFLWARLKEIMDWDPAFKQKSMSCIPFSCNKVFGCTGIPFGTCGSIIRADVSMHPLYESVQVLNSTFGLGRKFRSSVKGKMQRASSLSRAQDWAPPATEPGRVPQWCRGTFASQMRMLLSQVFHSLIFSNCLGEGLHGTILTRVLHIVTLFALKQEVTKTGFLWKNEPLRILDSTIIWGLKTHYVHLGGSVPSNDKVSYHDARASCTLNIFGSSTAPLLWVMKTVKLFVEASPTIIKGMFWGTKHFWKCARRYASVTNLINQPAQFQCTKAVPNSLMRQHCAEAPR